jgi:K+-transporting ATPase ATPase A chain
MTIFGYLQIGLYLLILLLLVKTLGAYMARVYQGERVFLSPVIRPIERLVYRIAGVQPDEEMNWKHYAAVMLLFNLAGLLLLYAFYVSNHFCPGTLKIYLL